MLDETKKITCVKDVIDVFYQLQNEQTVNEAWEDSTKLFNEQIQTPVTIANVGLIQSVSENYEEAVIIIPSYSPKLELRAKISPILQAWCLAWKTPSTYLSTINDSPIIGDISVQGNDLTTTNLPIKVSGVSSFVPPSVGANGGGPVTCTCTAAAVQTTPVVANISNGMFTFSGKYPKTGGNSSIHTEENKFSMTPKNGNLWPFNALKEGWREDEEFLKSGDKVVVLVLDNSESYFITDIYQFS